MDNRQIGNKASVPGAHSLSSQAVMESLPSSQMIGEMGITNEFLGRYLLYFKYIKNIDEIGQFVYGPYTGYEAALTLFISKNSPNQSIVLLNYYVPPKILLTPQIEENLKNFEYDGENIQDLVLRTYSNLNDRKYFHRQLTDFSKSAKIAFNSGIYLLPKHVKEVRNFKYKIVHNLFQKCSTCFKREDFEKALIEYTTKYPSITVDAIITVFINYSLI